MSLLVFIGIAFSGLVYFKNNINSEIVTNLEGAIYYTKRVDGISTLFKSDSMTITDYISNQAENIIVTEKKGSIYITKNGE